MTADVTVFPFLILTQHLFFFNGRSLTHAKVLRDDSEIDPIPAVSTADANDLVVLAER